MSTKIKLHQVVAVSPSVRGKCDKRVTEIYQQIGKADDLSGLIRTYLPDDAENGEKFPDERKDIKATVKASLDKLIPEWKESWDLVATQETGNTEARANIVLDGRVILENVPVGFLLFLEKQLDNVYASLEKLPTLDPAEQWQWDANANLWKSVPRKSIRTAKKHEVIVKYAATDKHPAQTELIQVDKRVGEWTAIKTSGAVSADQKNTLMEKCRKLREAVLSAREEANTKEVTKQVFADKLLREIFG